MVVEPFQYRNDPEQPLIAFLTIEAIGKPLNSDLSRRYPSNPVFLLYLFASAYLSLALEVGDSKEDDIFDRISKDEILRWPSQATVSMPRGLRLLVAKSGRSAVDQPHFVSFERSPGWKIVDLRSFRVYARRSAV